MSLSKAEAKAEDCEGEKIKAFYRGRRKGKALYPEAHPGRRLNKMAQSRTQVGGAATSTVSRSMLDAAVRCTMAALVNVDEQ